MAHLQVALCTMVDEELADTPFRGGNCPWIDAYITRYSTLPEEDGLAMVRRWTGVDPGPLGPDARIELIVARARRGVREWREGRSPGVEIDGSQVEPLRKARSDSGAAGDLSAPEIAALGPGRALGARGRVLATAIGVSADTVRVHAGSHAASLADRAGAHALAIGSDLVFGRGAHAPETPLGDVLLAHELAHARQHQHAGPAAEPEALERNADRIALRALQGRAGPPALASGGLRLQRCEDWDALFDVELGTLPEVEQQKIEEALQSGEAGDVYAVLDFGSATEEQRIQLLRIALGPHIGQTERRSRMTGRAGRAVGDLWASFGDRMLEIAEANPDLWTTTMELGVELDRLQPMIDAKERFRADTRAKALEHIANNRAALQASLDAVGGASGTLTDAHRREIARIRALAMSALALREALADLRQVPVGFREANFPEFSDTFEVPREAPLAPPREFVVVDFDPTWLPPPYDHDGFRWGPLESDQLPSDIVARYHPSPYRDVKDAWDRLTAALAELASSDPLLFSLVKEDGRLEEAVDLDDEFARQAMASSVSDTGDTLDEGVRLITSRDLDDRELQPIHAELFDGATTASGTDWSSPIYEPIGRHLLDEYSVTEFLVDLSLAGLAAVGFIVAELATAGTATFFIAGGVGLAASGAEIVRSWERWDDLVAAARVETPEGDRLVYRGQVTAQLLQAVLSTAFVFLDLYQLGRGAKAAWRAARETAERVERPVAHAAGGALEEAAEGGGEAGARAPDAEGPAPDGPPSTTADDAVDSPAPDGPTSDLPGPGTATPTPDPGDWRLPPTASLADEVADRTAFETALQRMPEPLRAEVLADEGLQRALVNGGYDPDPLMRAWQRWGDAQDDLSSSSFAEYINQRGDFTTAPPGGTARPPNRALTDAFPDWASWTPTRRAEALMAESHPELLRALDDPSSGLSDSLRTRVRALLDDHADALFNNSTMVNGARQHFVGELNEALGRLANDVDELVEITTRVPSANQGSIGEAFTTHHLVDDAATTGSSPTSVQHRQFTRDQIPDLDQATFNPDQLDTAARQTTEVKTGYHGGAIEAGQPARYDALREASWADPAVASRVGGTVTDNAVVSGLERHNWLFLPAVQDQVRYLGQMMDPSQAAAVRLWRSLNRQGLLEHQRVFFMGMDGQIREVMEVTTESAVRTEEVGTSLADVLAR